MDLRTQKIYDSLIQAFEELIQEKSFDEITVNELCSRANTRRATFYKHFSDKYDFFQFMLGQQRKKIIQDARDAISTDNPSEMLHSIVDIGLRFVEDNKELLRSIENSSVANIMLQTLIDQMFDNKEFQFLPEDEMAVQFLIGGLNQCTRWWIVNINNVSRKQIQTQLYALVDQYMDAMQ
ncbi:MAG: TetR/AcrR family transcriptional regulator [Eubacteriaceae bacterium]|jgi:AcrR family transcriptional regulator